MNNKIKIIIFLIVTLITLGSLFLYLNQSLNKTKATGGDIEFYKGATPLPNNQIVQSPISGIKMVVTGGTVSAFDISFSKSITPAGASWAYTVGALDATVTRINPNTQSIFGVVQSADIPNLLSTNLNIPMGPSTNWSCVVLTASANLIDKGTNVSYLKTKSVKFEYTSGGCGGEVAPTATHTPAPIVGDYNGDGIVNKFDYRGADDTTDTTSWRYKYLNGQQMTFESFEQLRKLIGNSW